MRPDLAVQLQDLLRELCKRGRGESAAQAKFRVALSLGISERAVQGLLSGDARSISGARAESLLRDQSTLLRAHLAQAETELQQLNKEAAALRQRLRAIEGQECGTGQAVGCGLRGGSDGGPRSSGSAPASASEQWRVLWSVQTDETDCDDTWCPAL
jgi:hypothetical protein